ncbi:Uncharacterised protein [Vibrio cholerae]|nr:Uncharacterised protein [Vibrio cholerae]
MIPPRNMLSKVPAFTFAPVIPIDISSPETFQNTLF